MRNQLNLAVGVPHAGTDTETFIRRYCEELSPRQTSVVCYAQRNGWPFSGDILSLDHSIFGMPLFWKAWRLAQKICRIESPFGDRLVVAIVARFLMKHEVSTVFSQYLPFGWSIAPVCKRLGLRHIVRGHGYDLSESLNNNVWRQRYQELNKVHAIVVPTEYQKQKLIGVGLNGALIHAIPCGVDIPAETIQRDTASGAGKIRCLAVGRLTPKKAPQVLLNAFLAAASQVSELRLTLVGDGVLRPVVEEFIKRHPLADTVEYKGALPHAEVKKLFLESHIFLQHSVTAPKSGDQEGAPVAIMEAMANSLPVISTRHAGIPHLVAEGETGLLVDEFDEVSMGECIIRLAKDFGLCELFGKNGRAKAIKEFSWEKERDSLLHLMLG